jgi:hypothetical protein
MLYGQKSGDPALMRIVLNIGSHHMTMLRSLITILTATLLSGCSGFAVSEHFEIANDGTLQRFEVYDWLEEEPSGPSFGVYRPPVFGFEHANQIYVIYPIFIHSSTPLLGPPLIPFLPIGSVPDEGKEMIVRIRHQPGAGASVEPTSIELVGMPKNVIPLQKGTTDPVGTIFLAKIPLSGSESGARIIVTLSDGSSKPVNFVRRKDRCYLPLFSFNSPNPRPSLTRYGK